MKVKRSHSSGRSRRSRRDSSSSSTSSRSSSSGSSPDRKRSKKSSKDESSKKEQQRKLKKLQKKEAKRERKLAKAQRKAIKKQQKEERKAEKRRRKELKRQKRPTDATSSSSTVDCGVPLDLMNTRARAPETREEYEARQAIVRRVLDPETGRSRLVKGDGEIIEECVSRERHMDINRQATAGDGAEFQRKSVGWNVG